MKKIKVKLSESFKIIITDDYGTKMFEKTYAFDPSTLVYYKRDENIHYDCELRGLIEIKEKPKKKCLDNIKSIRILE